MRSVFSFSTGLINIFGVNFLLLGTYNRYNREGAFTAYINRGTALLGNKGKDRKKICLRYKKLDLGFLLLKVEILRKLHRLRQISLLFPRNFAIITIYLSMIIKQSVKDNCNLVEILDKVRMKERIQKRYIRMQVAEAKREETGRKEDRNTMYLMEEKGCEMDGRGSFRTLYRCLRGRFNYNNHGITVPGIAASPPWLVPRRRLIVFSNRGQSPDLGTPPKRSIPGYLVFDESDRTKQFVWLRRTSGEIF